MKIIEKYKEKYQNTVTEGIAEEADRLYTIKEYKGQLYYAINGIPTIVIDPNTTAEKITQDWHNLKKHYVEYIRGLNTNTSLIYE